jgi:hypothetical protein
MSNPNAVPIIRLEIEHMKAQMLIALSKYAVQIDSDIQNSVEAFCTPENLEAIIDAAVKSTLKLAIEQEISNFFRYGKGNAVIREVIQKQLTPEEKSQNEQ